jgi:glgC: glucose-1-phosphate adenylyltransferase
MQMSAVTERLRWMIPAGLRSLRRSRYWADLISFQQEFMSSEEDSWSIWLSDVQKREDLTLCRTFWSGIRM